jgi:hypothetical protein
MWQYVAADERQAITSTIELAASRRAPRRLVWLTFEPGEHALERFELAARVWPGDERTVLAYGRDHGPPIEWLEGR